MYFFLKYSIFSLSSNLERGILVINNVQLVVNDSLTTISNKPFLLLLKHSLQTYKKILKICFGQWCYQQLKSSTSPWCLTHLKKIKDRITRHRRSSAQYNITIKHTFITDSIHYFFNKYVSSTSPGKFLHYISYYCYLTIETWLIGWKLISLSLLCIYIMCTLGIAKCLYVMFRLCYVYLCYALICIDDQKREVLHNL